MNHTMPTPKTVVPREDTSGEAYSDQAFRGLRDFKSQVGLAELGRDRRMRC